MLTSLRPKGAGVLRSGGASRSVLKCFSTDRFRRNAASPQEEEETEEHHAAAEDSREAGLLGEYQPGEERRDDGLGEDGAGDHRRLDVAERPVKNCVAHEIGAQ